MLYCVASTKRAMCTSMTSCLHSEPPPRVPCKAARTTRARHLSARAAHCRRTTRCPPSHLNIIAYLLVDLMILDGLSLSTASHLYIKVFLLLAQEKDSLFVFILELPYATIKCDPHLASLYTCGCYLIGLT